MVNEGNRFLKSLEETSEASVRAYVHIISGRLKVLACICLLRQQINLYIYARFSYTYIYIYMKNVHIYVFVHVFTECKMHACMNAAAVIFFGVFNIRFTTNTDPFSEEYV